MDAKIDYLTSLPQAPPMAALANVATQSFSIPFSNLAVAYFDFLAAQIEQETLVQSSPSQMLQSDGIATIKALDRPFTIERILQRIDERPLLWMVVLADLTGANPVPQKERGNVRAMVARWKQWGRALKSAQ